MSAKVVLLVADRVSGLIWPPAVAAGEEVAAECQRVFERAQDAGLALGAVRGVTSDGAQALRNYLARSLTWVSHQRCVFHLCRKLAGELAARVHEAAGLVGEAAKQAGRAARRELVGLIRAVFEALTHCDAQRAFERLAAHPRGKELARLIDDHLDAALVHLLDHNQGLGRASPMRIKLSGASAK